jgi:hypothetical protein
MLEPIQRDNHAMGDSAWHHGIIIMRDGKQKGTTTAVTETQRQRGPRPASLSLSRAKQRIMAVVVACGLCAGVEVQEQGKKTVGCECFTMSLMLKDIARTRRNCGELLLSVVEADESKEVFAGSLCSCFSDEPQGHVIEFCNMKTLLNITSSTKPTLEIAVIDAEGCERTTSTTVNHRMILVVRNDTRLHPAAKTPGDEEHTRDRKIEAERNLLSPPALPDEALALQDGCPSGHAVRWKPVGDTWLKVCMDNLLPLMDLEQALSVAQEARFNIVMI